jgi:hypothetical protein
MEKGDHMHLHRRTALAILSTLAAALIAAGCSSHSPTSAAQKSTTTITTPPPPPTTSTSVSLGNPGSAIVTTTTTATNTTDPNYLAAQKQWEEGACVASAVQGQYWQQAATDLSTIAADATQVSELKQLISLPDMGLSATQSSEYQTDMQDLDAFFATPNLYGSSSGNCPS